jgi:outer membrane receptor protein involved in Fe transport
MIRGSVLLTIVALLVPRAHAYAQTDVVGQITASQTGQPVASASVAIMRAADSTLAGGALTAQDGTFRIAGLPAGDYYLRIVHIAYRPATRPGVGIDAKQRVANLGRITLNDAVLEVDALTATAERSNVRLSAERNTYLTRDMAAAIGGNATDVLRNVPSVEVDPDGKVSLRGNTNVAIQINGRAAPARGDQIGQYLQQLPASTVERVEVVPNPSAKYDPDGMAGIVNIVLKSNVDLGLSGGLSLAAGTGKRYNASGNVGYQGGPLTLFGSYAFMDDARTTTGFSERENLFADAAPRFIDQDLAGSSTSRAQTLNTNAEVKLGKRETVGTSVMLSERSYRVGSVNSRVARDDARTFLFSSSDVLGNASTDQVFDGTLSFRRTIEPRKNELLVDLRYYRLEVDMDQLYEVTPTSETAERAEVTRVDRKILALNDELTFNADLTKTVQGIRVESGVKAGRRRVTNDVRDPRASFIFGTDESVQAAYTVLTREAGSWEVQGGLRVERTGRSYDGTGDSDVNMTNLFPSALAAYKLDENTLVKASYSRRIRRPETFMLNSILFYEDALNRSRGNPALRPEFTNVFELGYQRSASWGTFTMNPFLRQTSGAIRVIRTTQSDTTTGVFANFDNATSYGADMAATLRGDGKSGMFGINAFRHETEGAGGMVYGAGIGWSARASGNLSLSKSTDVQASAQYRAPMKVHQGRLGAFGMTNFSLRHKLKGEKAMVTLRVTDPFDMMRNRRSITAVGDELPYILESERSIGARGVTLGLTYAFGQAPKLRAPRKPDNDGNWDGN